MSTTHRFWNLVLELTDMDGLGLAFEKLGDAVPNERIDRQ